MLGCIAHNVYLDIISGSAQSRVLMFCCYCSFLCCFHAPVLAYAVRQGSAYNVLTRA